MNNVKLSAIFALFFSINSAFAADIKVGTGGETGNYFAMGQDIKTYCDDVLLDQKKLTIISSNGSVENLIGMGNKSYTSGIVQEDVLQFYHNQDPKRVNPNRLKIISGLHSETFHLLIPKDYEPKGKSSLISQFSSWMSNKETPTISIQSLKGQSIGAVGGATVSAKALSYFLNLNLNVHAINRSDAKKAVAPLLIVGGQPDNLVKELLATKKYRLVGIDSQALKETPFYMETTANYQIDNRLTSVQTIGVRAYLIGKSFRKKARNGNMIALATCIDNNLEDLADDADTNPNWASVIDLKNNGEMTNWAYFSIDE